MKPGIWIENENGNLYEFDEIEWPFMVQQIYASLIGLI